LDAITTEIPIALELDRGAGYLKVAKKLTRDSGKVVVIVDAGELTTLQDYFGKDNLTVEKTSVKYAEFFPKGAPSTTIKVAASGMFTTTRTEIRELEETQEGYYIPFDRYSCVMKDKPSGYAEFSDINKVVLALITAGQLKKEEVFYSRKAGMRAIKKTKLKEMTWDIVVQLAKKCYTVQDYKSVVHLEAKPFAANLAANLHRKLDPLWEKVKHNYPMWDTKGSIVSKGVNFLRESELVTHLEKGFNKEIDDLRRKFEKEHVQFHKDFPVLQKINYWSLSDTEVNDIITFCEWKQVQTTLKNKAA
jgi:hypothetical protein